MHDSQKLTRQRVPSRESARADHDEVNVWSSVASVTPSATERAMRGISALILRRQLLPGQQVRQEDIAQRLSISRIPVREALKALQALGFVDHEPNRGYFVKTLSAEFYSQSAAIRRFLETEALRRINWPAPTDLKVLTELNQGFSQAIPGRAYASLSLYNRRFHFSIFGFSSLKYFVQEIERFWVPTEAYQAVSLPSEATLRLQARQHAGLIDALRTHNSERLVAIHEEHRSIHDQRVLDILAATKVVDGDAEDVM